MIRHCCYLALLIFLSCQQVDNKKEKEVNISELDLVWSDEFDTPDLVDTSKWSYVVGDGCPNLCGWGNNELQYYSDGLAKNSRIEEGKLIIEAIKESSGNSDYTSAKIVSKGNGDWKYGRLEISAKLPSGVGTWPAIWMLPTDETKYGSWPKFGEIDIMEHVGYNQDSIFGTIHTDAYNHLKGTQKEGSVEIKTAETEFHEYVIDWNEDRIQWFVDNKMYHEFKNEKKTVSEWPFDQPFYLILNVAVGGSWGGRQGVDEDIWPQRMEVDYVRVYQ